MKITSLEPMTDLECQENNGGFLPLLFGVIIGTIALPIIKNLWNSVSGNVKLPGGIEAKWDNENKSSEKITAKFEKDFEKLQETFNHLIPPFYEF